MYHVAFLVLVVLFCVAMAGVVGFFVCTEIKDHWQFVNRTGRYKPTD